MSPTRRQTLRHGLTALTAIGLSALTRAGAHAQEPKMTGDTYPATGGDITIQPVNHASFVMTVPGLTIYNDPVGGPALYKGLPSPDLILITHEHSDHFDIDTLDGLVGKTTRLIVNPRVYALLSTALKAKARALANGESTEESGIKISAIPAYNTTKARLNYHPKGRDNGYLLAVAGKKIYIAGDTEETPEMRALKGIDIAFLPMNLPYTMDINQAAAAVAAFAPKTVYPYHYRGSDTQAFAALVSASGGATKVVLHDWYKSA